VFERTVAAWKELELNPVLYAYETDLPAMEEVRAKAASLLHCTRDEVVLTRGTTDGMNAVACGLELGEGDHVLTTDQEHGGGRQCWDYLVRRRGIVLDVVPVALGETNTDATLARFREAVTPKTRVFSFSHILYSTGLRMPVAQLSALAREHGCVSVVDGAQAPGGMAVDVESLGCDIYATSGHKWLLGPKATGLLVVREKARDRVRLVAEENGRKAQSESTGLTNVAGVLGLGAAIDYVTGIGIGKIEAHNLELRNHLYALLGQVRQIRMVSPPPGPLATPLITVQLPDSIPAQDLIQRILDKHQVMLKPLPKLPNGIRFSTHLFNTTQDVDRAIEALTAELG
jgi:selenocysteine lyase/cysteine desulfurase